MLSSVAQFNLLGLGQTSANRTQPGTSFQLYKWLYACCAHMLVLGKMIKLIVGNGPINC